MGGNTGESKDESSIKPVSSLRSHFESIGTTTSKPAPPIPKKPSSVSQRFLEEPSVPRLRDDGRVSLDIPRDNTLSESSTSTGNGTNGQRWRSAFRPRDSPSPGRRPRPMSVHGHYSPPKTPLQVKIDSPKSSPKLSEAVSQSATVPRFPNGLRQQSPTSSRPPSPTIRRPSPNRPLIGTAPRLDTKQPPAPPPPRGSEPKKSLNASPVASRPNTPLQTAHSEPPPINRSAKPKPTIPILSLQPTSHGSLAPVARVSEDAVSPFSTPPSSEEDDVRTKAKGFKKSPVRLTSKESHFPPQTGRPPPNARQPIRSFGIDEEKPPEQPPRPQTIAVAGDKPEDRPGLPPRRDARLEPRGLTRQLTLSNPPPRSMDILAQAAGKVADADSKFMPPPKRASTIPPGALHVASPLPSSQISSRASIDIRRPSGALDGSPFVPSDSDEEVEVMNAKPTPTLNDYPDSSQSNRRPPRFRERPYDIATKYDTKLFAVAGEFLCTAGYYTRAWSLRTGELLMSISHGENTKMTALVFKPAQNIEDQGKRIWVGSTTGEIQEIDIPSQTVITTKSSAHSRREVIKIYRHAGDLWSLDVSGRVNVWPPDETGTPNLTMMPQSFNVFPGHTFSMMAGKQLWLATGREIRIYEHNSATNMTKDVTSRNPLAQAGAGDVTSGAIISSQADRIYFGHIDGKVSVYSRKDYSCISVVSVSLYKLSTLVGVGDYLWAGYNTGMIYIYDTSVQPWMVKKDWHAHESTIAGIVADRTSLWHLNRLQVVSLGTDNVARLWDGMLSTDWLESEMQQRDTEFCDFREVSALVTTWNAGAVKPTALRHDQRDANFFQEHLTAQEPPDILIFGFQELVDLEDKKVTAKSFFKKKKDSNEKEHMSHRYREWRDHLARCLQEHIPDHTYVLLHTCNLIGLFTCIFVKDTERQRISYFGASEVKLGMGGYHGNKGSLIVRFVLDDTSLCFVNCHLAAGQSQTVHRNNHVAGIMESTSLPVEVDPERKSDIFVGGGDGSMILDHEICILNGDLNYRIDTMSRDAVIAAVQANNIGKLLERDQLLLSRKKNPRFRLRAFNELPITFAPTYKYDVGTDSYDTSEKKRSPAWCDRILYRGLGNMKQVNYKRHEIRVSDHRPVSGLFKLRVKTIIPPKKKVVMEQCEARFEEVYERVARDTKLDYLMNVFGLPTKEAERLLR
ncbi:DNase I-like protein [Eremomyces bilateralis CBS 781.70]|uniref:DNase I-like protein n=1 Tax=Eremomyces bilateralis CBS 781.70 TaxID=1392243 RepID=A0A6G1FV15_9PEZI|nr:DNase I-like protein [Eremomyces bilateralis CBS 781.70]KAF1809603.1 DNase I-like protein [Eremomyces bilateralis CBS 781.70]